MVPGHGVVHVVVLERQHRLLEALRVGRQGEGGQGELGVCLEHLPAGEGEPGLAEPAVSYGSVYNSVMAKRAK